MPLGQAEIGEIEMLLRAPADPAAAAAALRRRFPDFSVTLCDPSDVDAETPYREWARYALYLVDNADHCWRLTDAPERATGLVIVANRVPAP